MFNQVFGISHRLMAVNNFLIWYQRINKTGYVNLATTFWIRHQYRLMACNTEIQKELGQSKVISRVLKWYDEIWLFCQKIQPIT